ncbi:MAG: tripartite tricarboxylate transporter substrate binding protein [Burkholderiaceae bacterium]
MKKNLLISLLLLATAVGAQTFPDRPVKLVVPLTAGSGADIVARILAKHLTETWKQPVLVENKPGAGGLIGTGFVANATPDGYTLLLQSASYAANPAIYKKLPYDPAKGLVEVSTLGTTPYVMVTSPDGPYKTLKDLISAAKDKPGSIPYASAGLGSSTHLTAEYFTQSAGIEMLHIPYKGSPEAIQDSMTGRTAFYMAPLNAAIAQVKGGKLRVLGITSNTRSDAAPELTTIAEQGHPNFDIGLWFGVWAPFSTPVTIVKKINADINRSLQDPEIKAAYVKLGMAYQHLTSEEFEKFVRIEVAKFQKIAKLARLEPQ